MILINSVLTTVPSCTAKPLHTGHSWSLENVVELCGGVRRREVSSLCNIINW